MPFAFETSEVASELSRPSVRRDFERHIMMLSPTGFEDVGSIVASGSDPLTGQCMKSLIGRRQFRQIRLLPPYLQIAFARDSSSIGLGLKTIR